MFLITFLKDRFLYMNRTHISRWVVMLRCKLFSDWLTQNVTNSGMAYHFVMSDLSLQLTRNSVFSKQYRDITNHLHLYVNNYYIFVCTVTLLLLGTCLTLVNTNISSNMTVTPIDIFGQISSDVMDICFNIQFGYCVITTYNYQHLWSNEHRPLDLLLIYTFCDLKYVCTQFCKCLLQ